MKIKQSSFVSYPVQKIRLNSRRKKIKKINILGLILKVLPGVYDTSGDTELLAKTCKISKNENFLEVGTGSGAVAIYLASKAKEGIAVDINPVAVKTTCLNLYELGINNLKVFRSDLFSRVNGKFNVILFNPPYSSYAAKKIDDRMFWDKDHKSKIKFFKKAGGFLKPKGRIYFGWANFKDLEVDLPIKWAAENKFKITKIAKKHHKKGFDFIVFEMKKARK